MLATLVQILIGGILQGGIYALGAFGLSIIFGVLHVLNVAHGDVLMLGGLLTYWLVTAKGWSPFHALIFTLPLFFLLGLFFQRVLIRPIASKNPHEFLIASILVTLGVSLMISDSTAASMGQPVSVTYPMPTVQVAGLDVSSVRLLFLGIILALTAAMHVFLTRTFLGSGIRGSSVGVLGKSRAGQLYGENFGTTQQSKCREGGPDGTIYTGFLYMHRFDVIDLAMAHILNIRPKFQISMGNGILAGKHSAYS